MSDESENARVIGVKKFKRTAGKSPEIFSHGHDAAHPPEKGGEILLLILNIDRFVMIFGIDDDRQMKLLRVCLGKAGVAIGAPLHWCAAPVAVAQVNVVTHSDLIAVVDDWSAGHR